MFYFQKRLKRISVFIITVFLIILFYETWIKNKQPSDLREFWANVNVSKNFTIEFMDQSIQSSFIILPNVDACKEDLKYLIVVISRTASFDSRDAIRETWLNPNNSNILRDGFIAAYFLVGIQYDITVMMKVIEESKRYNDLIAISITDTYNTLTLKVYAAMYFKQTYCKHIEYYIKVDDDVILDLDRLNQQANSFSNLSHIYGALRYNDLVVRRRTNKYYMPYKCYPHKFYPTFAPGMMYVIPSEAFRKIWQTLPMTIWLRLEDVFYTGVVAEIAGVNRTNINFMYSADNVQTLPDQWICDQYNRSKLVAASSFANSNDLRKFYKKLREIKCLKDEKKKKISSKYFDSYCKKF